MMLLWIELKRMFKTPTKLDIKIVGLLVIGLFIIQAIAVFFIMEKSVEKAIILMGAAVIIIAVANILHKLKG